MSEFHRFYYQLILSSVDCTKKLLLHTAVKLSRPRLGTNVTIVTTDRLFFNNLSGVMFLITYILHKLWFWVTHDLQLSTRSIQLLQTSITYAKTCHHLIFYMHNIASWSIWPADAAICKCICLLVMKIEELHLFYLKY